VAKHAGVSVGTVSHVLNATMPVKEDLRRRVYESINLLGYKPNKLARGFRRNQTNLLGMVIPDIVNPFFPALVRGAEDGAHQASFNLVLCNTDNDSEKEAQYIEELRDHRMAGVILIPSGDLKTTGLIKRAGELPIVCLDRRPLYWEGDSVTGDNFKGAQTAAQYLLQLGHRRIAMISGPHQVTNAFERREGFCVALRKHNVAVEPGYIQEGQYNRISGYEKTRILLALRPRPTAILAANDLMAYGALVAIRDAGLNCPKDISLVGFDDLDLSELTDPPLTTVAQPVYQMGAEGVNLLLKRIAGSRSPAVHLKLPTDLKLRHSAESPARARKA
jgi:DNA-binding LacI/PurR family transcriptional regulator